MISEEVKSNYRAILDVFKNEKKHISERSKKLWQHTLFIFLAIEAVLAFLVMLGVIKVQGTGLIVLFIIPIIVFMIPIISQFTLRGKWVEKYKDEVLKPIVEAQFPGITYEDDYHISEQMFNASNLFTNPDRFNGEDLFSGKLDATAFSFSEIHAEEKHTSRDKDGNTTTSYSTIFKGLFLIADFNKEIQNDTYVYSSGGKSWFSRYKRVRLEDPVFEDRFNVYSNDQVEARYILTPKIMERIVELEDRFGENLYLSFRGHNVYIAISESYDMFETSFHDEVNFTQIERFLAEVDSILAILNDLDLNLRIWTKR
ncbi:uncharacterized protein DUF3137 [Kordia periserrulae]|uniref:Uncharacterized protein DUF3137 n=1 Tax=Kordia periserrulae TaxID=701523 RepID=A0A2T6BXZ9_9FLAO|nr:DUF3137 domain-containing protein [Kordia periserrulae]PTX60943.1 uncharacterized protein DUF3137 [Kordia periserrulae]